MGVKSMIANAKSKSQEKKSLKMISENELMKKEIWNNDEVTDAGKSYLTSIVKFFNVNEIYMGDIFYYSAKVLVLEVTARDKVNLQMEYRSDYTVNAGEVIFVEVCFKDDYDEFAIQVSNDEGEPLGFIDLGVVAV